MNDPEDNINKIADSLDGINASLRSIAESFVRISEDMRKAIEADQQAQRRRAR